MGRRLVVLAALGAGVLPAAAAAHVPSGARGGEPVVRAAQDAGALVAARSRYFGAENVDQRTGAVRRDRAIFSWVGVSNFVMALRGHVVLLDAWVPRGLHSGYVPSSPQELASLRPELILLGHAHFDHAADAVPIAEASGAVIAGLPAHCAAMRGRASGMPGRCIEVLRDGVGTAVVPGLLRGVEVTALRHLHSGAQEPDGQDGYHVPVLPAPPLTTLSHPPTPQDMAETVRHVPDAEGGSVLYRFRAGGKSIVWHDTSGPLKELNPGTFPLLRDLRPVDVQLGAIQSFNQVTNGMRDPRLYLDALRPDVFVPHHHDDWAPGITGPASTYRTPLRAELERMPPGTRPGRVVFLEDPVDYVRPEKLTFALDLAPPRLVRRCVAGGLRVGLSGDTADVGEVLLRVPGRRGVVRLAPDRTVTLRAPRGVLRAALLDADGRETRKLRRRTPAC